MAPGGGQPDPSDKVKSFFDFPKVQGGMSPVEPPPPGNPAGLIDPEDLQGKVREAPGGGQPDPSDKTKSFFDFPKVQGGMSPVEPPPPGGASGIVDPSDLKPPPGGAVPGGS